MRVRMCIYVYLCICTSMHLCTYVYKYTYIYSGSKYSHALVIGGSHSNENLRATFKKDVRKVAEALCDQDGIGLRERLILL